MKRQKSILILDDETMIGSILVELLAPIYEEVVFRSSAVEARCLVLERPFSLILSDVQMPQLPGPDFVGFVRSQGRIEPIIFLTGNATREVLFSAIRLGVADVIEKPFDQDNLVATIDRVFEIDKRKQALYKSSQSQTEAEKNDATKQKKMIGLLQLVGFKK